MTLPIKEILDLYKRSSLDRIFKPTIAVIGPANSGKDLFAQSVVEKTELRFRGSCSYVMGHYVSEILGKPFEEAYRDRVNNRELWRDIINSFLSQNITLKEPLS
jgi:hypothetical protein